MEVLEAYKPFEIQELKLSEWKQRPIKNNFFELVLIKNGEGMQCINYNEYSYTQNNIFLLPPLQCHSFKINTPTNFIFLKFTDLFFKNENKISLYQNDWFKNATYILSNYNQLPGNIIKNDTDRKYLNQLIHIILDEYKKSNHDSIILIKSLMIAILELLIRNIKKSNFHELQPSNDNERINKILAYINEYIDKPDHLKTKHLANHFSMSPYYISEFFKKHVKISLREYIIKARLKLVEIRLLNSDYTLTEIADDLGFTDLSHLSKTFKRYVGISIREFKENGDYVLLKRTVCPQTN